MIVLQKHDALTVLWIVSFRDDDSASRFGTTYKSILDKISAPDMAHRLQVKDSSVLIAIGDGARQFDRLLQPSGAGVSLRLSHRATDRRSLLQGENIAGLYNQVPLALVTRAIDRGVNSKPGDLSISRRGQTDRHCAFHQ